MQASCFCLQSNWYTAPAGGLSVFCLHSGAIFKIVFREQKICLRYFKIGQTYFEFSQTYFQRGLTPWKTAHLRNRQKQTRKRCCTCCTRKPERKFENMLFNRKFAIIRPLPQSRHCAKFLNKLTNTRLLHCLTFACAPRYDKKK